VEVSVGDVTRPEEEVKTNFHAECEE
jgi:hypothetical protein